MVRQDVLIYMYTIKGVKTVNVMVHQIKSAKRPLDCKILQSSSFPVTSLNKTNKHVKYKQKSEHNKKNYEPQP